MRQDASHIADVSVIIAAYNAALFIERALDSVMGQTRAVREVIVVDDCSGDRTVEVVERFAAKHPSVSVICLEHNGGPSRARNAGIRSARGSWIAILDADDAMKADRLETMLDLAERCHADFVADNQILYDTTSHVEVRTGFKAEWSWKDLTLKDVFDNDLPGRSPLDFALLKPLVRKAFLQDQHLNYDENERNGEDFKFMTDILFAGARAVLTSYPGYIYSTRFGLVSNQASSATRSVARFDRLVELSDMLERKYAHLIDDNLRASIRRRRRHLKLIHEANVARELRVGHRYARYAQFVLLRPPLFAMLAARTAQKLARQLHSRMRRPN